MFNTICIQTILSLQWHSFLPARDIIACWYFPRCTALPRKKHKCQPLLIKGLVVRLGHRWIPNLKGGCLKVTATAQIPSLRKHASVSCLFQRLFISKAVNKPVILSACHPYEVHSLISQCGYVIWGYIYLWGFWNQADTITSLKSHFTLLKIVLVFEWRNVKIFSTVQYCQLSHKRVLIKSEQLKHLITSSFCRTFYEWQRT